MDRINVQEKVDAAKFNRFHLIVFFWTSLVVVLDGYDLAVPGVALPAIMATMKVTAVTAGFMASSALFGMAFGAIVMGTVADRIGRRKVFAISIFLFSAFTMAAGFSTDPVIFSGMRFLAGVGIGGALPNAVAHMSEYAPRRSRGRLVGWMMCGYTVGSVLAALIGKQCIETYGWRSVFIVAGVPLLIIPFVMAWMPESLVYLIKSGKQGELRKTLRRVLPHQTFAPDAVFVGQTHDREARTPFGQLFADGRGKSTMLIWVAFFMGLFMLYAMSTWLVTLLTRSGHTLGAALTFLLVYNAGVIIGTIVGAWVGDRFSLKWVLVFFYAMGAASLATLGYAPNHTVLFVLIAVVGASVVGTQNLCYAYTGQFYPLASRSAGLGAAAGVGRVGAIVAPLLLGVLVSLNLPATTCFMAIAVASAIGCVAIAGVNHRRCASAANPGNLQFEGPTPISTRD